MTSSHSMAYPHPQDFKGKGGLCMLGGVYTNQKCPGCGKVFEDEGKRGLFCPDHPECQATRFFVRFKNGIFKRFRDYESAQRFLTGLRYKQDEGTFDPRDYRKDNPLGFENLALQWLEYRKDVRCWRNLKNHIGYACDYFQNKNIKEVGYAELEDFLRQLPGHLSDKSKHNIKTTLHSFWTWLRKRRVLRLDQMPEFPEIKFELSWRAIVDKETQERILDEIHHISYQVNPRIWIGVKWLCTYIGIRPIELIHVKEGDFNLSLGVVNIRHNKEKKPKIVPLLDEDVALIKSFPTALPHLYFFRHQKRKGVHADKKERFGKDYLYTWWKRACKNLGIEGIDLYGGTRHSSAIALREYHSPEQIKRATFHATNKAFERYFQIQLEDLRSVYGHTKRAAPNLHQNLGQPSEAKLLKFVR